MTGCVTAAPETWIAVACGLKQMFLHERSQIVLALWMKKRTLSVCMLQFWNVCRGKCPYILQTAGVRRNKLGYCAVTNLMSKVVDRWTAYNRHDSQCCHSPCEEAPCPFLLQSLSLAQMGAARNSPAVCLWEGGKAAQGHMAPGQVGLSRRMSQTFPFIFLNFFLWKFSKT